MKSNDYEDGGEDVFIEIPAEFIRDYRQGERREQYVNDIREDAGFTEISLYAMQPEGSCIPFSRQKQFQKTGE